MMPQVEANKAEKERKAKLEEERYRREKAKAEREAAKAKKVGSDQLQCCTLRPRIAMQTHSAG